MLSRLQTLWPGGSGLGAEMHRALPDVQGGPEVGDWPPAAYGSMAALTQAGTAHTLRVGASYSGRTRTYSPLQGR